MAKSIKTRVGFFIFLYVTFVLVGVLHAMLRRPSTSDIPQESMGTVQLHEVFDAYPDLAKIRPNEDYNEYFKGKIIQIHETVYKIYHVSFTDEKGYLRPDMSLWGYCKMRGCLNLTSKIDSLDSSKTVYECFDNKNQDPYDGVSFFLAMRKVVEKPLFRKAK